MQVRRVRLQGRSCRTLRRQRSELEDGSVLSSFTGHLHAVAVEHAPCNDVLAGESRLQRKSRPDAPVIDGHPQRQIHVHAAAEAPFADAALAGTSLHDELHGLAVALRAVHPPLPHQVLVVFLDLEKVRTDLHVDFEATAHLKQQIARRVLPERGQRLVQLDAHAARSSHYRSADCQVFNPGDIGARDAMSQGRNLPRQLAGLVLLCADYGRQPVASGRLPFS
mmetsp:Transcript_69780/g.151810  ORF Transcript_69780/g.151810 Transcript_69780/m.151810 type:complete len:223 (+) Transcript_69780:549-1217(+)